MVMVTDIILPYGITATINIKEDIGNYLYKDITKLSNYKEILESIVTNKINQLHDIVEELVKDKTHRSQYQLLVEKELFKHTATGKSEVLERLATLKGLKVDKLVANLSKDIEAKNKLTFDLYHKVEELENIINSKNLDLIYDLDIKKELEAVFKPKAVKKEAKVIAEDVMLTD